MNTTNVFVELLVIGIGPVTAVILIALVVLGPGVMDIDAFLQGSTAIALAVPMLASAYILGIVLDRLADHAFKRPAGRIRREYFDDDQAYHDARRTVVFHSETIYRLRQYGRSRMRICRGWAINSLLLAVPASLYVGGVVPRTGPALLLVNGILAATLISTILAWRTLSHSEYQKIRGSAEFIRNELNLLPRGSSRAGEVVRAEPAPGVSSEPTEAPVH